MHSPNTSNERQSTKSNLAHTLMQRDSPSLNIETKSNTILCHSPQRYSFFSEPSPPSFDINPEDISETSVNVKWDGPVGIPYSYHLVWESSNAEEHDTVSVTSRGNYFHIYLFVQATNVNYI